MLLVAGENGIGKRTPFDDYRRQSRGGKGIITMRTTDKTGRVVGVKMVTDDDQIMLVTSGGKVIRLRVNEIRIIGRNTQGVRLIGLAIGLLVVGLVAAVRAGITTVLDRAPTRGLVIAMLQGAAGDRAGC